MGGTYTGENIAEFEALLELKKAIIELTASKEEIERLNKAFIKYIDIVKGKAEQHEKGFNPWQE